jgi:hypothetical protein
MVEESAIAKPILRESGLIKAFGLSQTGDDDILTSARTQVILIELYNIPKDEQLSILGAETMLVAFRTNSYILMMRKPRSLFII